MYRGAIMHHTGVIVRDPKSGDFLPAVFCKFSSPFSFYIVQVNSDIVLSVRSHVFMVNTKGMCDLMNHNPSLTKTKKKKKTKQKAIAAVFLHTNSKN